MTYMVIRVRSDRGVTKKIRDTMAMLNLTREIGRASCRERV